MIPRLSGHFSTFGLVLSLLNSLLGIARQWSREKFAILTLKPRSHVRVLIYRTWAIKTIKYQYSMVPCRQYLINELVCNRAYNIPRVCVNRAKNSFILAMARQMPPFN